MGALTAMQSHQAVIAETLVSWSPRRKVGHPGSNSQHRGELHEPARSISDERESGTGNSLRHILVTWHRSSADYAVRRRWSHRAPLGPHHPAHTRAETADDRCAGCTQRHSAWTLRGQSPIQRTQRAGRAARPTWDSASRVLSAAQSICPPWSGWPTMGFAIIRFTQRHCARQHELRC
jgi:hypothetical protein